MTKTLMRLLLCSLALLALSAPAALAKDIYSDCSDNGRLDGKYTPQQIRNAKKHIPTDIDEYTDCRDVLNGALTGFGGSGSGSGSGSSGGGSTPGSGPASGSGGGNATRLTPSTPAESKSLDKARTTASGPVTVNGERIVPGAAGFAANAARHSLPWQLLVVLILLGLAASAASIPALRRYVVARRGRT